MPIDSLSIKLKDLMKIFQINHAWGVENTMFLSFKIRILVIVSYFVIRI